MNPWVIKFRRPLARPYDFKMRRALGSLNFAALISPVSAVAGAVVAATGAAVENHRRARRARRGRKPDNTAEPFLKKDAPWTPREKDGFSSGHSIRYWTGRYWTEDYNRAWKYPTREEAEVVMFTVVAQDMSLIGELETDEWVTLSKPKAEKIVPKPATAEPPAPTTMIVSKPKKK